MDCLVVGGNGFIGSHLVDRLLQRGQSVRIYDRSPNEFRGVPAGVEYVRGELENLDLLKEAVEGMEVVYHFASSTLPKTSNDDPVHDIRSNLVNTIHLLEVCVAAGVRKVVFPSSGGTVYGATQTAPVDETHPTNPISSYGIVKLAIEKYLKLFDHLHGLDYTVLRISNLYGPYQNPASQQGVISVFLYRVYTGQPITIWGDGSVIRDYLYISDLVDALETVAQVETQNKLFNIGSGRGTSLNDLIDLIAAVIHERPAVEYLSSRLLDVPTSVLDASRARRELGWGPKTDLTEGIARTWEWLSTLSKSRVEL